jgi:hypothetical protein
MEKLHGHKGGGKHPGTREDLMTGYKFKAGETVYFRSDKSGSPFQITKHMPVRDGDFQYRLKGTKQQETR